MICSVYDVRDFYYFKLNKWNERFFILLCYIYLKLVFKYVIFNMGKEDIIIYKFLF